MVWIYGEDELGQADLKDIYARSRGSKMKGELRRWMDGVKNALTERCLKMQEGVLYTG